MDTLPAVVQKVLAWNPLKIWFDALVSVYTQTDFPEHGGYKLALTLLLALALGLIGLRNWRKTE